MIEEKLNDRYQQVNTQQHNLLSSIKFTSKSFQLVHSFGYQVNSENVFTLQTNEELFARFINANCKKESSQKVLNSNPLNIAAVESMPRQYSLFYF